MKSKKLKLFYLIPLSALSTSLILPNISCSTFIPNLNPQYPPIPPNNPSNDPNIDPATLIDFSSTKALKKDYLKAIEKIKPSYLKIFNSNPINPNENFGNWDIYYPHKLGLNPDKTKQTSDLLLKMIDKWKQWDANTNKIDKSNYLFNGYLNYQQLLIPLTWFYWIGINYNALAFYEFLKFKAMNTNNKDDDFKNFFEMYLPTPQPPHPEPYDSPSKTPPYINLLLSNFEIHQKEQFFQRVLKSILKDFYTHQNDETFNSMKYYINSYYISLTMIKNLFNTITPDLETNTPSKTTFYQFYPQGITPEEQHATDEKIKKDYLKAIEILPILKKFFI